MVGFALVANAIYGHCAPRAAPCEREESAGYRALHRATTILCSLSGFACCVRVMEQDGEVGASRLQTDLRPELQRRSGVPKLPNQSEAVQPARRSALRRAGTIAFFSIKRRIPNLCRLKLGRFGSKKSYASSDARSHAPSEFRPSNEEFRPAPRRRRRSNASS